MICKEMTFMGGTETTEGIIPHKRHPAHGYNMPVMLEANNDNGVRGISAPQEPMRSSEGFLVYAMPGGAQFVDSGVAA